MFGFGDGYAASLELLFLADHHGNRNIGWEGRGEGQIQNFDVPLYRQKRFQKDVQGLHTLNIILNSIFIRKESSVLFRMKKL